MAVLLLCAMTALRPLDIKHVSPGRCLSLVFASPNFIHGTNFNILDWRLFPLEMGWVNMSLGRPMHTGCKYPEYSTPTGAINFSCVFHCTHSELNMNFEIQNFLNHRHPRTFFQLSTPPDWVQRLVQWVEPLKFAPHRRINKLRVYWLTSFFLAGSTGRTSQPLLFLAHSFPTSASPHFGTGWSVSFLQHSMAQGRLLWSAVSWALLTPVGWNQLNAQK